MPQEREIPAYAKHKIKKRTRHVFYEGSKYHRRCMWHGTKVYIIYFASINRCQIEMPDGSQKEVNVDDAEFKLVDYKL